MAYLNEFPHMEANKLNLDWLLEQYSTFNKRIKEIQDHFDEVAAEMASEVNQLEQDFDDFKQTVNTNFSNLSHDIEVQVNAAIADIQRQIDAINNNMETYISEHMNEWQMDATYNNTVVILGDSTYIESGDDATAIQVNGVLHNLKASNANVKAFMLAKTDTYSATTYTYTFTINNAAKLGGIFLEYNCPSVDGNTHHIINSSNISLTRNGDNYDASVTISGLTLEGANLITITGYYLTVN